MKKLLTLTAVLAIAFFMDLSAQVPRFDTAVTAAGGDTTLVITAHVDSPKTGITVILGKDTIRAKDTLNIPNQGYLIPSDQVAGVPIPPIVQLIIVILGTIAFTVLPAIQAVLKVIPTEKSVLIQGWLGKILNFATAFIKDDKAGGGFHQ